MATNDTQANQDPHTTEETMDKTTRDQVPETTDTAGTEEPMTADQMNVSTYDATRPGDAALPTARTEDTTTEGEINPEPARAPGVRRPTSADQPGAVERRATPDTTPDIEKRFTRHGLADARSADHTDLRDAFKDLAAWIVAGSPSGREQSLALTKLEEALFWANAAVARSD